MAMSVSAPATHRQPSRKGKRAWRKNVDITEVQDGLSTAREEAILTGGKLFADIPSDDLFQTDSTGDAQIRDHYRKSFPNLKADEILAQRSAVPAIDSRKRKTLDGKVTDGVFPEKRRKQNLISRKELERLRGIAYGDGTTDKTVVVGDHNASYDPWDKNEKVPSRSANQLARKQMVREPNTMRQAPLSLLANGKMLPNVSIPKAGRSYNPSFEDWDALVKREGEKEVAAELKRRHEAEAERLKMERIEKVAAEAEKDNDDTVFDEYESEWEGFQSDVDETQLTKKRPQRKTPAERNKAKRRKEAERLAKHEAKMSMGDLQIRQLHELQRSISKTPSDEREVVPNLVEDVANDSQEEDLLRKRPFGKHPAPNGPLEVVLADELQDSLRRLKPEGNLLKDRFRNMIVQGKIESRLPVGQVRKPKTKATEKWSYKDWKLPVRAS